MRTPLKTIIISALTIGSTFTGICHADPAPTHSKHPVYYYHGKKIEPETYKHIDHYEPPFINGHYHCYPFFRWREGCMSPLEIDAMHAVTEPWKSQWAQNPEMVPREFEVRYG